MTCLPRPTYDELSEELAADLRRAIETFAARHGLTYDSPAFNAQSSYAREGMHEVLGFGLDLWPTDADAPEGEPLNVIPFEAPSPASRSARLAAAAAGVMALAASLAFTPMAAEASESAPAVLSD